ncbi:MAG: DUF4968 domain-containing protein [Bacteroidetes bacterium]|nr:MAG: DUF4968 domain-containing protein [Bacteroidota bacterium]
MKKINLLLTISLFFLCNISFLSAQNTTRTLQKTSFENNILTLETSDSKIIIEPYHQKIIKVNYIPQGKNYENLPKDDFRNIDKTQKVNFKDTPNEIIYTTKNITLKIQKKPFQIAYFVDNQPVFSENKGYTTNQNFDVLSFNLSKDESLYGTGSRALPFDRRGFRLELYNKAHYAYEDNAPLMNFNIPVVISSQNYGLYFDNPQKSFLDLGKNNANELTFEAIGGRMSYYFITGKNIEEVTQNYVWLTGYQPMPPLWAFGNFISRYGYRSEKETRQVVNDMYDQDFAADAVILDHYWYGEGEVKKNVAMGNLDWYRAKFPNGEKMVKDFEEKGIKTILITQPFVLTNSKNYQEVAQKKLLATDENNNPFVIKNIFWFGETSLLDIFKPETKDWFWQQYKKHTSAGIGGWWGDLGEPEVHPSEIKHINGKADEVHNLYGHYWAKMIAEGYQKDFSNQRLFMLMRAGYAGSQRYGLISWSGDVHRAWGGLKAQPSLSLNMGLTGLAYMHSDLGGFANTNFSKELYLRWLQYGVFQPIFRPHSQEQVPSEPIFYADDIKNQVREIIKMRYKLTPYLYTMAWENSTKGTPLMRPLIFEEPENKSLQKEGNQYLWGKDILVAPILNEGQKTIQVYFPKKSNWYHLYNSSMVPQNTGFLEVKVEEKNIPVYVRGGAIIPTQILDSTLRNMRSYLTNGIHLHIYNPSKNQKTEGYLYIDDGKTPNPQTTKNYCFLKWNVNFRNQNASIQLTKEGIYNPERPTNIGHFYMSFVGYEVKSITKKAEKLGAVYDKANKILIFDCDWTTRKKINVSISNGVIDLK